MRGVGMRIFGKVIAGTVATLVIPMSLGVANAAAVSQLVPFKYTLSELAAGGEVDVAYHSGPQLGSGPGFASSSPLLTSGAIADISLQATGFSLDAAAGRPLSVDVTQQLMLESGKLVGDATIPAGTGVTLTNVETGKSIRLKNGTFSIPTGIVPGAKLPASRPEVVDCRGSETSCQAHVRTAGGEGRRTIVVKLPHTNLVVRSIATVPRRSEIYYLLSGGHFAEGDSEYVVTLNAARGAPAGSQLVLTFARG